MKKIVAAILLGCGFLAVLAILIARQSSKTANGRKIAVHFAVPAQYSTTLLILADKAGFFDAEGIMPTFTYFPTGQDALAAMLKGEADFAAVFETPVVHAALAGEKMAILTELHNSDEDSAIIYRKDKGIAKPEDLVGRRIAIVQKTNAEFVVELTLRSHLIDPSKVTIVPESVKGLLDSLRSGRVDAAGIWEPFISNFVEKEPATYGRMQAAFYTEFSVLVSRAESNLSQTEQDERNLNIIAALISARDFLRQHPDKAHQLVEKSIRELNPVFENSVWSKLRPRVGLSSTLLAMLNEEARWYQSRDKTLGQTSVDFREMLRPEYLKQLAPKFVTFE